MILPAGLAQSSNTSLSVQKVFSSTLRTVELNTALLTARCCRRCFFGAVLPNVKALSHGEGSRHSLHALTDLIIASFSKRK